jgi:preprotein translocase subunit SecA
MKDFFEKIFGSESSRLVKKYRKNVKKINDREASLTNLSQTELREMVALYRKEIQSGDKKLEDILVDVFAIVREAARRTLNERHYDVQLIGGQVLFNRGIAEMRTGEGKTLTGTAPVFLLALAGKGVHVVTVNDYLARRDAVWVGQVYDYLGLSVGVICRDESFKYNADTKAEQEGGETDERRDETASYKIQYDYLDKVSRHEAYECDITYGTNSEFGFDYLRDNLVSSENELVQRGHFAAIVDEVDSILIDESRTPLIISSEAGEDDAVYKNFANLASQMILDTDFLIEEKERQITLTEDGIEKAEKMLGIQNVYAPGNAKLVHHLLNAVKAKALFVKDKEYVIRDGEVVIVDEFTGRLKPGQRWSEGLHQAVEAKEAVAIKKESKTVASITYQNYFRLYENLCGMTGTAETSKEEFQKVYGLSVVSIPTHREVKRIDRPDVVYQTEKAKWQAITDKVKELHAAGRPVLIGTTSIEKNEILAKYLERAGVRFEILNAKNHERESEIIAGAGKRGSVVVATNMAGRGVDIKLGGPQASTEEREEIRGIGGLFVVGTERHEARRIDNQLRGRSGRQGDPGETQFYVSLEDEIMKRFGGDNMKSMMQKLNVPEDMPIESGMVSRMIETSQKKIEGFYFDMRKQVLQYDAVLNSQRDSIYTRRSRILNSDKVEVEKMLTEIKTEKPEIGELKDEVVERVGDEQFLVGTKAILLQSIDIHWMDHLDTMEHLRGSVALRGYGQHDPLVEYKREGLAMFKQLEQSIRSTAANFLYHSLKESVTLLDSGVVVQSQPVNQINLEDLPKIDTSKTGRNDSCPCGSGKKYKHCHGKSA